MFSISLKEFGSFYFVADVVLSEVRYILPGKYVKVPTRTALSLKNEIRNGKVIKIEKHLVENPRSQDIPFDDFIVEEPRELDLKKKAERVKVNSRLSAYAATLHSLDIFDFFVITGKLTSLGFNVMDESRKEDVFLEIINTGNEDLITDLERFLECKDKLDSISKKRRGIKEYLREVNECDTEEELEEVVKSNKGWLIN